jgi:hypothetical protein
MNGPDQSGYWQDMERELSTLEHDKHLWGDVDTQLWMNVLPSTCDFKCKRFSNGSVWKLKARVCVRCGKQKEGVD